MDASNIQFTKIELRIAKYLFRHYMDKHNARQLAKILNINHAHANKLCNILANKMLLVKEEMGNAVYFSYNYRSKLAIKFMEYVLSMEEKEFPRWLVVIIHGLNKFKPYIQLGLVFGSSIETKEFNDVDVLLVYNKDKSKYVKRIKEELRKSELVEKPIRYVDITEMDILTNKEDKTFYNILSNSMVFHNPEKYVEAIQKCLK